MATIRTDKWLLNNYFDPLRICKKLEVLFDDMKASEIYNYLALHGMYQPIRNGIEQVEKLQQNKVWELVEKEKRQLQKEWSGPDVHIFIFPSDSRSVRLMKEYNGKSGVAYKDKLFLLLSADNSQTEIKSMLTHEYNHVCRLSKQLKQEVDICLLDTIVMEGLAENGVRERFGEGAVAKWTSYYAVEQLERWWKELIYPNRHISKMEKRHDELLFGLRSYPNMIGYCIGYHFVKVYMESKNLTSKQMLNVPTSTIVEDWMD